MSVHPQYTGEQLYSAPLRAPWKIPSLRNFLLAGLHRPEDPVLDDPVENGILVVYFVVAERQVKLAPAVEFVVPRERQVDGEFTHVNRHRF